MTRYCVEFWAKRWCVRPELFALPGQVCTDYLRCVRIADYMNLRMRRAAASQNLSIAA